MPFSYIASLMDSIHSQETSSTSTKKKGGGEGKRYTEAFRGRMGAREYSSRITRKCSSIYSRQLISPFERKERLIDFCVRNRKVLLAFLAASFNNINTSLMLNGDDDEDWTPECEVGKKPVSLSFSFACYHSLVIILLLSFSCYHFFILTIITLYSTTTEEEEEKT